MVVILCKIGHRGCVHDNGPICDPCWATTTPEEQDEAKREHNEEYMRKPLGSRGGDMLFCSKPGCWQVVRLAEVNGGLCHRAKVSGYCAGELADTEAAPVVPTGKAAPVVPTCRTWGISPIGAARRPAELVPMDPTSSTRVAWTGLQQQFFAMSRSMNDFYHNHVEPMMQRERASLGSRDAASATRGDLRTVRSPTPELTSNRSSASADGVGRTRLRSRSRAGR